jgi:hypothetical protein
MAPAPQIFDTAGIPINKRGWEDVSAIANERPAFSGGVAGRQLVKRPRIIGPEPLCFDPANGDNDPVVREMAANLALLGYDEPTNKAKCLLIFEDLCANALLPTALVGRGLASKAKLKQSVQSFLTGMIGFIVMLYVHDMDFNGTSNTLMRINDLEDCDDPQMWEDANTFYNDLMLTHPILGRNTAFEFDLQIQKQYIFELNIKAWTSSIKKKIELKGIVSLEYLYELHRTRQRIQRKFLRAVFYPHAMIFHMCVRYTDRFWKPKTWYLTDIQEAQMKTNPTVFPEGRI